MSQYISYSSRNTGGGGGGGGTVTSVAMTVPAFLSVSGSPITTSGTLVLSLSGTALPIANGGTANTAAYTAGGIMISDGTKITQDAANLFWDTSTERMFLGTNASIAGSNAGIQYSNAAVANRGQIKLHSYFNGTSIAGVSTLTSRSGTIGVNNAVVSGQDYSKWTAQAGATTVGSAPISGTFAFRAAAVNSLTVPSDFHLQMTNLAGTLGERFSVSSEGVAKVFGQELQLIDTGGTNYTGWKSPASVTSTGTYTLPAADGTTGQVLTTNGSFVLSWTTTSGSGANTSLSNLSAVAINASLTFDADNTYNLGSPTQMLSNIYAYDAQDNSSIISIDLNGRHLKDSAGIDSINYSARTWTRNDNTLSANWQQNRLIDTAELDSLNWDQRLLFDITGTQVALDWTNRKLTNSANFLTLNWDNGSLLDPTNASVCVDWASRALIRASGNPAQDWENSLLYDSAGNQVLDYSATEAISIFNHLRSDGSIAGNPSVTPNANAGTGATATGDTNASDIKGQITLTIGTLPASGAQVAVDFNLAYSYAPTVILSPASAVAGVNLVQQYVTTTTTGFVINFNVAGVATSVYKYNYHVIG